MYESEPDQKRAKIDSAYVIHEQEEALKKLSKRLEEHDESKKIVYEKLNELLNDFSKQISRIESMYSSAIEEFSTQENNHLQTALKALKECVAKGESGETLQNAIQTAQTELDTKQTYGAASQKAKMEFLVDPNDFKIKGNALDNMNSDPETLMRMLSERIDVSYKKRSAAAGRLQGICEELKKQVNEFFEETKRKIEDAFSREDSRLRGALDGLKMFSESSHGEEEIDSLENTIQKAHAELLVVQEYQIKKYENSSLKHGQMTLFKDFTLYPLFFQLAIQKRHKKEGNTGETDLIKIADIYKLQVLKKLICEYIKIDEIPTIKGNKVERGRVYLNVTRNPNEERVLRKSGFIDAIKYKVRLSKDGDEREGEEYSLALEEGKNKKEETLLSFLPKVFEPCTLYTIAIKASCINRESKWGSEIKFMSDTFQDCCLWEECINEHGFKVIGLDDNRRIAYNHNGNTCNVIGNVSIPLNKVAQWYITIGTKPLSYERYYIKKEANYGEDIYVGVAPADINKLANDNQLNCGWYFRCYCSELWSGPPHNYRNKKYGPLWKEKRIVKSGDSTGVVVDTAKGELSFSLNGVNLGVAYEGIPLDKPLVPCVIFKNPRDSVEFNSPEVKRDVNTSIPAPANVIAKSITWNSITVAWSTVNRASFYQIEVNGSKSFLSSRTNIFSMKELLPGTEYSFRVRAVRDNSAGKWSDVVKGKVGTKSFKNSGWKECPKQISDQLKYSIDAHYFRIVTKLINSEYTCPITGNIPIPPNTVTSWHINVLAFSKNGEGIYIGVAPSDTNTNSDGNFNMCGWYFRWHFSTLYSGPPHNYINKEYGPKYIQGGDNVGVVMDTTRGELSFTFYGVNLGVAYEGIPLDKPLAPCVLIFRGGNSVELNTSEVKETVADSSIPSPSNVTAKSGTTLDSIIITWDPSDDALFYQIEVDGNKHLRASTTNTFTKTGLPPDTEHTFRVRIVRENLVSEWSDAVKGRTQKESFETSVWKEYPDCVDEKKKYLINPSNSRIATKISEDEYCTIFGNTPLPPNKVTSWSIKILKSKDNDGRGVFIGVAPSDINQNGNENYNKCGWYFNCHDSTLCSGPPHNYTAKEYGLRKELGEYVHTGDSVGVVMDTAKGELSFYLGEVNYGVAYEGIPLDKPLVPCVLLRYFCDSVELDTSDVKEKLNVFIPIPFNITAKSTAWNSITLTWGAVEPLGCALFYQVEVDGSKLFCGTTTNAFTKGELSGNTVHEFRVRAVRKNFVSEWSEIVRGRTLKGSFENSGWKKSNSYILNEANPRIVTRASNCDYCTIIGDTPLPSNRISSWTIKINPLTKIEFQGASLYVGVAPISINQNAMHNFEECGWYLYYHDSSLYSGPPHFYKQKKYGPYEKKVSFTHNGDPIGVVMDTSKGELSFHIGKTSYGVAYEGIPLDEPLVPCVCIGREDISIELDTSEVKETVNRDILPPFFLNTKGIRSDSIELSWEVNYRASFFQIEVDRSKTWATSFWSPFTLTGLAPGTEHVFRVCAVIMGAFVSPWSAFTVGRTLTETFETSKWKECPDNVRLERKYSVSKEKPTVGVKMNFCPRDCTFIWNAPLSPNKVNSWNILSDAMYCAEFKEGKLYIGVAPSDINQDEDGVQEKCGWYVRNWDLTLFSGPPHNYKGKGYGPRLDKAKGIVGDAYGHIGVVMDTTNGDLSFIPRSTSLGVAYEGIPLDKPLVPCVVVENFCNKVILKPSEVKEYIYTDISIPNISSISSRTWDSITVTWDECTNLGKTKSGMYYQVQVDESKFLSSIRENAFTLRGVLPETEHTFRVRFTTEYFTGPWSSVVKGKSLKKSFETSGWKECPDSVEKLHSYYGDSNPRAMTMAEDGKHCTIIGIATVPFNKDVVYDIKIIKSRKKNNIHIGVAPFDIDQNADNGKKCGWYFYCYNSKLRSGPPHNYKDKVYGPRKEKDGNSVSVNDTVRMIIDTRVGALSFAVNGVNYGIAYGGIPLDKPLVPCAILTIKGDTIELSSSMIIE